MSEVKAGGDLIRLLEEEAVSDLSTLDLPSDQEDQINIEYVKDWYFETEKLIRVLANTLPSSMAQPINQLRYAGHHVLKAGVCEDEAQSNLIEAYKHCKRAYYDAVDLYVYHMSETYRDKLAFLPADKSRDLAKKLREHLEGIQAARFDSPRRINYYSTIRKGLIDGLKMIQCVNEQLDSAGVTRAVLEDRGQLLRQNQELRAQIDKELKTAEKKFNKWMVGLTVFIVLTTAGGLVFQGVGTQMILENHKYLHIKSEGNLFSPPAVSVNATIDVAPDTSHNKSPKNVEELPLNRDQE